MAMGIVIELGGGREMLWVTSMDYLMISIVVGIVGEYESGVILSPSMGQDSIILYTNLVPAFPYHPSTRTEYHSTTTTKQGTYDTSPWYPHLRKTPPSYDPV